MANTFLTVQEIAREALIILRNQLVARPLVRTDYSNEFAKKGDTIQVKKPATFTAQDFSSTISAQNITESNVLVTLDKFADVSVNITSKEKALNLDDFSQQVLNPAMIAIAEKVDSDIVGLYKDVPYYVGTSGTTPDGMDDFANAAKKLNDNKVPMTMRNGIWDSAALAKFQQIANLFKVNEFGGTQALREGEIGRLIGIDNYMSQQIKTHTAGTFTAVTTPLVNGAKSAGATTISMDGGVGTETLKTGDLMTIGGYQYVVTADFTATGGAIANVSIYPALKANVADNAAITFPDKTATAHVANLVFHRNAFAFVTRPLEVPEGGANGYVANFEGLNIRVTQGYDMSTKTEIMSFDIIYGVKTLFPELAVQVLG